MATEKTATTKRKKKVAATTEGIAHIKATFNNILVTITDMAGNTISWSTAGRNGFKGSKKNTPYAAQVTVEAAAKEAIDTVCVRSMCSSRVRGQGVMQRFGRYKSPAWKCALSVILPRCRTTVAVRQNAEESNVTQT